MFQSAAAAYHGTFGNRSAIIATLVQSTPLILTGLAMVVAFTAQVWNIGGEGQFFAGALATIAVTKAFSDLPGPVLVLVIIIGSALGGAAWGYVPGLLRGRFGTNEAVVTVMMNYVMVYLVAYIAGGVWQDPASFAIQTAPIPRRLSSHRFFLRVSSTWDSCWRSQRRCLFTSC